MAKQAWQRLGDRLAPARSATPWEALHGSLRVVTAFASIAAYAALMALMVTHSAQPRWDLYAAPLLLLFCSLVLLVSRGSYRLKAVLFVGVAFGCCLAANLASGDPYLSLLYALVCLLGGVLLGPAMAALLAAAGTGALLLTRGTLAGAPLIWSLVFLWLTAGVCAALLANLFLAIAQAEADVQRAWSEAQEARVRRGELVRAQKALGEMYDMLQRANHELAIARQQADEARQIKTQFAANVSHELRTPLNLIMGFSEIMYQSPEVYGDVRWTPALRADIREIHQASRHLLGMVDDILDLSRIEAQRLPLRLERTDLLALIRETVASSQGLLRGKDVALQVDLPQTLPEVLIDRTRIRQVLLNLLNNAIRFTDSGSVQVSAQTGDKQVTVTVTDTGVGIPARELQAIFDEFHQAQGSLAESRGGAGLGLAICKQFVRLHGGEISAESQVGKGSAFRFSLPVAESASAPAELFYYAPEGWTPPVPENPLGKTAIVLGHDPSSCAAIARVLSGYRVLPSTSLQGLAERVSAEHPAGIVVVESADGSRLRPEEVWQAAGRSDLPVLTCLLRRPGAFADQSSVRYLTKPVQREALLAAVRRLAPSPTSLLVVDDDPGFVALLQRLLATEFEGVRVRCAYSGAEALDALNKERFDVVLLDVIMPGIDGTEVLAAMRGDSRTAQVPVLITTGSAYGEDPMGARAQRLEVMRGVGWSPAELGRCLSALLDAVPPDYARPTPGAGPQTTAVG
ncbi:MAG: ATP-binding response regulator [Anaerolineae bacterium]